MQDDAGKKAVAEKLTPVLDDLQGLEFFDRDTGKIKINNKKNKTPKEQTAEEKLSSDFRALTRKSCPQHVVRMTRYGFRV